jgi:hypothetical protein
MSIWMHTMFELKVMVVYMCMGKYTLFVGTVTCCASPQHHSLVAYVPPQYVAVALLNK